MSVILTKKQQEGLELALEKFNNGEKGIVIAGYAGSGKSTLVRYIIDALPVEEKDVVYCSYTGKATLVLKEKGNQNAKTLHKLLYKHFQREDGTYARMPKDVIEEKVVVVDEISMVPKDMAELLFSYPGIFIICLGDPGQLPPIFADDDNHLLDHPHVFLDEIMRQAQDSEIIKLTMDIRAGKPLQPMKGKEVQVYHKNELTSGMLLWADQVIVATNKKRDEVNSAIRQLLGKGDLPEEDDKIICQKNYWGLLSTDGNPMLNGLTGHITNLQFRKAACPPWVQKGKMVEYIDAMFEKDDEYYQVRMDKHLLETGEKALSYADEFAIVKNNRTQESKKKWRFVSPLPAQEFLYGYAISCWKAQGSEWDNVLVIEENFPCEKEEHMRFLYTAATRAKKKLVVIMKD